VHNVGCGLCLHRGASHPAASRIANAHSLPLGCNACPFCTLPARSPVVHRLVLHTALTHSIPTIHVATPYYRRAAPSLPIIFLLLRLHARQLILTFFTRHLTPQLICRCPQMGC
jgi:hypothetical protein